MKPPDDRDYRTKPQNSVRIVPNEVSSFQWTAPGSSLDVVEAANSAEFPNQENQPSDVYTRAAVGSGRKALARPVWKKKGVEEADEKPRSPGEPASRKVWTEAGDIPEIRRCPGLQETRPYEMDQLMKWWPVGEVQPTRYPCVGEEPTVY